MTGVFTWTVKKFCLLRLGETASKGAPLTSTESSTAGMLSTLRLPPIPGVLTDLISEGVRARQRRTLMALKQDTNLVALSAPDATISRCVQAAAIQGDDVLGELRQMIQSEKSAERRSALNFLFVAVCVQVGGDRWLENICSEGLSDPEATAEALLSFPVPKDAWGESTSHIYALWHASLAGKVDSFWASYLLGAAGCRDALPELRSRLSDGDVTSAEMYALAALGDQSPRLKERLQNSLQKAGVDASWGWKALHVSPGLLAPEELRRICPDSEQWPQEVWPWLAVRAPETILLSDDLKEKIHSDSRLRLFALMGHISALFAVCSALSESGLAVTAEQQDVLLLVAGECPSELSIPGTPEVQRQKVLRTLFLRVCRQSHIAVPNDADECPWLLDRILAMPLATTPALRFGYRMAAIPVWDARLAELSHVMRQWLYMERAARAGHALPLSATSVSRRQWQALDISNFVDDLRS
ncbi:MAG: hypothetical protein C4K60_12125 [Ideonella sp. MAG2]|nr:MAG: hypothetical protein C4K60_12125 [Ideonella sp. MAG2]